MTIKHFQKIPYPVFKKIIFLEKSVKLKCLYTILNAHTEANVHIHKYT